MAHKNTEAVLCAGGANNSVRTASRSHYTNVGDLLIGGRYLFTLLTSASGVPTNREAYADAYAMAKPSRVLVARCNTWHTQAIAPMAENIGEAAIVLLTTTARATRAANRQVTGKTLDAAKGNGGRAPFPSLLVSLTENQEIEKE